MYICWIIFIVWEVWYPETWMILIFECVDFWRDRPVPPRCGTRPAGYILKSVRPVPIPSRMKHAGRDAGWPPSRPAPTPTLNPIFYIFPKSSFLNVYQIHDTDRWRSAMAFFSICRFPSKPQQRLMCLNPKLCVSFTSLFQWTTFHLCLSNSYGSRSWFAVNPVVTAI